MPYNSETGKIAGALSKRGPAKIVPLNVKEKMELLYEDMLDHLITHQEDLTMSERVKLLQNLSNYLIPKVKPIRDDETLQKLKERSEKLFSNEPDPRE
jgi:hypothetical protein